MNSKEIRNDINKLLTDMQALASKPWTTESRASFDAMNQKTVELEADAQRVEAIESRTAKQSEFRRVVRPTVGPHRGNDSADVEERKAQFNEAFRAYARGNATVEQRDMLTTSDSTGGALVPTEFYGELTEALKFFGPVATLIKHQFSENGRPTKVSISNDTANGLTLLATEGTSSPAETDAAYSSKILGFDTVSVGLVKVSVEEVQDSQFSIENLIRSHFAKRYGRGMEAVITLGKDSAGTTLPNQATGGLAALATVGTTTSVLANGVGWDDLTATFSALDPAYINPNTVWLMSSQVRGILVGLKDGFGRPYFTPDPVSDSPFARLLGYPVVLDQALPTSYAANGLPILFGDPSSAMLLKETEFSVLKLSERYMDTLEYGFFGFTRIGSVSLIASGAPAPFVSLKLAAS
jgi:HK97 family phage major capsid protein